MMYMFLIVIRDMLQPIRSLSACLITCRLDMSGGYIFVYLLKYFGYGYTQLKYIFRQNILQSLTWNSCV